MDELKESSIILQMEEITMALDKGNTLMQRSTKTNISNDDNMSLVTKCLTCHNLQFLQRKTTYRQKMDFLIRICAFL